MHRISQQGSPVMREGSCVLVPAGSFQLRTFLVWEIDDGDWCERRPQCDLEFARTDQRRHPSNQRPYPQQMASSFEEASFRRATAICFACFLIFHYPSCPMPLAEQYAGQGYP